MVDIDCSPNRSPSPLLSFGSRGCISLSPQKPAAMKRLKSSLKLARSDSASLSTASTASSSLKNVRFAAELTTVKKFDSRAEPISISTENSPTMNPICLDSDDEDDGRNEMWFNDLTLLPSLLKNRKNTVKKNGSGLPLSRFQLDYDSDSGLEDDDDSVGGADDYVEDDMTAFADRGCESRLSQHNFEVVKWDFLGSNVQPFVPVGGNPFVKETGDTSYCLEKQLFDYLQGSNIRLHSLGQADDNGFGRISGLIYVNNLNFEKFIEIKYTFNGWRDIHYMSAAYYRSISPEVDEFKFTIDLNVLKYSLQVRNLIFCNQAFKSTLCPLDVEFCCRYDVNGETYYDNNSYENYQMRLMVTTQNKADFEEEANARAAAIADTSNKKNELSTLRGDMFARDFLVSTTMSHSHAPLSSDNTRDARRFSDDTDYYNTSPLRHLYHNDTSLIRPTKMNEILINSDYDNEGERQDLDASIPSIPDAPSLLACHPPSVSDSNSSYSSVSSPSEDFNLMDNAGYYHYSSTHSLSSLELNSDMGGIGSLSVADIGMTLGSLDTGGMDPFDDIQSVITDTVGETYDCNNSTPRNNSADTLITPAAMQGLASPHSISSSTSNVVQDFVSVGGASESNHKPTSTPIMKAKDVDYQNFLSSYCFYTRSRNEVFPRGHDDAGSSPSIQAVSPV